MKTKKNILYPKHQKILDQLGGQIKLARKRRKLTTIQVAERASINRTTLYHIERGNPSVSMGSYFNVLRVLHLENDYFMLASDDEFGRKLQELQLLKRIAFPEMLRTVRGNRIESEARMLVFLSTARAKPEINLK